MINLAIVDPKLSDRHRLPFPDRFSVNRDAAIVLNGNEVGQIIDALKEKASSEGGTLPLRLYITVHPADHENGINLILEPFRLFSVGTEWRISIAS